jgi:hypothetical protein
LFIHPSLSLQKLWVLLNTTVNAFETYSEGVAKSFGLHWILRTLGIAPAFRSKIWHPNGIFPERVSLRDTPAIRIQLP